MNKNSLFFKILILLGVVCLIWGIIIFKDQTNDYNPNILINSTLVVNNKSPVLIAKSKLYYDVPKENDIIGTLSFPKLNRTVSIIQGSDKRQLKQGAGHYIKSALPGEIDNCVISGHRETAFRDIGKLIIGDIIIIETSAGRFIYVVITTRIVDADDRTVIVPKDIATLTLTTCYPFNTPGYFPQRYIVSAELM